MHDTSDVKNEVLQELMDKMRELEGGKLRPKAVEVSVSSMKPELEGQGETEPVMLGKTDDIEGEHEEPDDDELSPEDRQVLEQLFGDKEHEG